MTKMKWETRLDEADGPIKRKILGENSARLYRHPLNTAMGGFTGDQIALMKAEYQREGVQRNNAYYGYVPKLAEATVHPKDVTPMV